MLILTQIYLLIFALALLAGGILGFVKAASKISLVMGILSALLIGFCFLYTMSVHGHGAAGLIYACVVCLPLLAVFCVRWLKSKRFLPAGLLAVLTIGCLILSAASLYSYFNYPRTFIKEPRLFDGG